ncbi:MAG: pyridoxal-phosphate dependent enzyme [Hahellaceae bacterium]|nr:pyridoxal-phosphate dependent enzyme [Hahellaceae bacterium]
MSEHEHWLTIDPLLAFTPLIHPEFAAKSVDVQMLRMDQVHPKISGNKWFKLQDNLLSALSLGYTSVLSFGGAYSNHLHALAYAGKLSGLQTIGVVRGAESKPLTPTLLDCAAWGMHLHPVTRKEYSDKKNPEMINRLTEAFGNFYLIPEGGSNERAVKRVAKAVFSAISGLPGLSDNTLPLYLCSPLGSGGTFAGLVAGACCYAEATGMFVKCVGYAALKGFVGADSAISSLLSESGVRGHSRVEWHIDHRFHSGGFAKVNDGLMAFLHDFESLNPVEIEPVYTAKMLQGVVTMVAQGEFPAGSRILVLHTGGLQGRRGFAGL